MDTRQIEYILQIAEENNITKAAEKLFITQSALNQQLLKLEKELGTRLFDRMGKQVVLTPQGQKFLMHANTILYEVNRTRLSMHEDEELKNPLHIGTIESLCAAKFPAIVSRFREHHPQVKLQITVGTPEELIRMMEHDQLDIIYILDAPRWSESWVKAMEVAEPVVFVASPAFWAQKYAECEKNGTVKWSTKTVGQEEISVRQITLDQILQEPFFLTEKNANYRQALDQHLASCRCCLSPVLEISDTAFIIQMLEQSRGLSFLPLFAVQKQIWEGTLAAVEVDDVEISMYRQIFYHKNKFRTREMEQFIIFASEEENH